MISANTPPGTKVVAVAVDGLLPHLPNLAVGSIYTIDRMVRCDSGCIGVVTMEHPQPWPRGIAYERWAFRYLDLPKCLTSLQTARTTGAPKETEPA